MWRCNTVQMLSITIIISLLISLSSGLAHHRRSNAIQDVDDIYYEIYGDEVDYSDSSFYEYYSDALLEKANYYLELFEWFKSNYGRTSSKSSTKYQHSPRSPRQKTLSTNNYRGYGDGHHGVAAKLVDYAFAMNGNKNVGKESVGSGAKKTGDKAVKGKTVKGKTVKGKTVKGKTAQEKLGELANVYALENFGNKNVGKASVGSVAKKTGDQAVKGKAVKGKTAQEKLGELASMALTKPVWSNEEVDEFAEESISSFEKDDNLLSLVRLPEMRRCSTLYAMQIPHHLPRAAGAEPVIWILFQRHCESKQNKYKVYSARDSPPSDNGLVQLKFARDNAGEAIMTVLKEIDALKYILRQNFQTHFSPLVRAVVTALYLLQTIFDKIDISTLPAGKTMDNLAMFHSHFVMVKGLQEDGGGPSQQSPIMRQALKAFLNSNMDDARMKMGCWIDRKYPQKTKRGAQDQDITGNMFTKAKKKMAMKMSLKRHGLFDAKTDLPTIMKAFLNLDFTDFQSMLAPENQDYTRFWSDYVAHPMKVYKGTIPKNPLSQATGEGQAGRRRWINSVASQVERNKGTVFPTGGHSNGCKRSFLGDETLVIGKRDPFATPAAQQQYRAYVGQFHHIGKKGFRRWVKDGGRGRSTNLKIPNTAIVLWSVNAKGQITHFRPVWDPSDALGGEITI